MPDTMVVNVDTWGSGPNALKQGEVVPTDCPGDIAWATENKVIVTAEQYQQEHPEWRPPGARQAEAKEEAKEEAESKPAGSSSTSTSTTRSGSSRSS